jgi:hypothetical protein
MHIIKLCIEYRANVGLEITRLSNVPKCDTQIPHRVVHLRHVDCFIQINVLNEDLNRIYEFFDISLFVHTV